MDESGILCRGMQPKQTLTLFDKMIKNESASHSRAKLPRIRGRPYFTVAEVVVWRVNLLLPHYCVCVLLRCRINTLPISPWTYVSRSARIQTLVWCEQICIFLSSIPTERTKSLRNKQMGKKSHSQFAGAVLVKRLKLWMDYQKRPVINHVGTNC